jgi:dipeptidyl aminopeptidase/acylaminoacyl peptidase
MRFLVTALALLGPTLCWAQLTPQQAISVQHISGVTFAPDGQQLAFTVESAPKGRSSSRDVWLSDGSAGHTSAFTNTGASFDAQWSPDGRELAYLSRHDGVLQVYVAALADGKAVQLTHHGSGVGAFCWSPDGKQIAFLASAPQIRDSAEQDPRIIKIVSGSDVPTNLWMVDIASRSERQITSGAFNVAEVIWKADGSGLIALASDRPDPEHWTERLYLVDPRTGIRRQIFNPKAPIEQLELSPDGKTLSYVGPHSDGYTAGDLYLVPATGGVAQDLTGTDLDRPVDHYRWRDNASLIASFAFGFVDRLYTVSTAGKLTPVADFDAHPEAFDLSSSGTIAFVQESASEPPELWIRSRGGRAAQAITTLNGQWSSVPRAKAELIHYTSFDGTPIEAELLRPAGAAGGKLPTITLIHGGPVGRWSDRFDPEGQLLASHGYAVFYPNIRGADGYGQHMIDLIRSVPRGGFGWATGPLKDVLAGVDALVQRGVADPNRLGIGGWSYGGYMAALALSRTDRFRTGVAGAGFYDMVTDLGTEIASYVPGDEWMYGNFFEPRTQDILHQDSPIATVRNIHAPLLLMHGELDPVDTIGQTFELFRALQTQGVTTQLVVYPREGHELREEAHIVDRLNRTLAWFDDYLKGLQNDVSAESRH